MPGKITEIGNRYGRWKVIEEAGRNPYGAVLWRCRCDCGTERVLDGSFLRRGTSRSCGCLRKELAAEKAYRHGTAYHPLHGTWRNMVSRCQNEENTQYHNYGGRGIEIFEEWQDDPRSFIEWVEENLGQRPKGHTLDRIDNDGNYEPGNLRWADGSTQRKNTRRALYVSDAYYKLLTEPIEFVYREG